MNTSRPTHPPTTQKIMTANISVRRRNWKRGRGEGGSAMPTFYQMAHERWLRDAERGPGSPWRRLDLRLCRCGSYSVQLQILGTPSAGNNGGQESEETPRRF